MSPVLLAVIATLVMAAGPLGLFAYHLDLRRREALVDLRAVRAYASGLRVRAVDAELEVQTLRRRVAALEMSRDASVSGVRPVRAARAL